MKKIYLYLLLLVLGLIIILFMLPMFGLPSKKVVNEMRTERLRSWQSAVISYNRDHQDQANNLYDVFKYQMEKKIDNQIKLVILDYGDNEGELFKKHKVLEDKDVFNEKIDYELMTKKEGWFIKEKKSYPRLFKDLWAIDREGNISPIIQE